jgi:ribonuclease-3
LGADLPDDLLRLSLTHPSTVGEGMERTLESNQRLEFLGDAVLGAAVAAHFYESHPDLSEGELTLRKIALVQKPTLASAAKRLNLGEHLILGRGEELAGGRERKAILADALEALIGAIYLAHGFKAAQEFALRALDRDLEGLKNSPAMANIKNLLQEKTQAMGMGTPSYATSETSGPPHARSFFAQVLLQEEVWGEGNGGSKKDAECRAAQVALDKLSLLPVKQFEKPS